MRTNGRSQALFGGLLWGDRPVRFVFMDEAGTSQHEPVTVVVAITANADENLMSAEALILETLGAVPPQFQRDFCFHATEVFAGAKYKDQWSLTERLNLLYSMMAIPRRLGMAITVSCVWRGANPVDLVALKMTQHQFDHIYAF